MVTARAPFRAGVTPTTKCRLLNAVLMAGLQLCAGRICAHPAMRISTADPICQRPSSLHFSHTSSLDFVAQRLHYWERATYTRSVANTSSGGAHPYSPSVGSAIGRPQSCAACRNAQCMRSAPKGCGRQQMRHRENRRPPGGASSGGDGLVFLRRNAPQTAAHPRGRGSPCGRASELANPSIYAHVSSCRHKRPDRDTWLISQTG